MPGLLNHAKRGEKCIPAVILHTSLQRDLHLTNNLNPLRAGERTQSGLKGGDSSSEIVKNKQKTNKVVETGSLYFRGNVCFFFILLFFFYDTLLSNVQCF